jgi:hypothetical protein
LLYNIYPVFGNKPFLFIMTTSLATPGAVEPDRWRRIAWSPGKKALPDP